MEVLKKLLDSKVTEYNICSKEIVELSQALDKEVVAAQKKLINRA